MNGYTTPLNTQSPNCCGNQPYSGMNTVMPKYQTAVPPVQSAGPTGYGPTTTNPAVNPAITAQLATLNPDLSSKYPQNPNYFSNQPSSGTNTVMPTNQTAVPPAQSAGTARYGRPTTEPVVNPTIIAQLAALSSNLSPITPLTEPQALTLQSTQYFNGFLRTQIGKKVTVDFLIGTNTLVDKTGTLLGVGANFILINEIETDDLLICDFYTIKFVKVYY